MITLIDDYFFQEVKEIGFEAVKHINHTTIAGNYQLDIISPWSDVVFKYHTGTANNTECTCDECMYDEDNEEIEFYFYNLMMPPLRYSFNVSNKYVVNHKKHNNRINPQFAYLTSVKCDLHFNTDNKIVDCTKFECSCRKHDLNIIPNRSCFGDDALQIYPNNSLTEIINDFWSHIFNDDLNDTMRSGYFLSYIYCSEVEDEYKKGNYYLNDPETYTALSIWEKMSKDQIETLISEYAALYS